VRSDDSREAVTVIGLGLMGQALARAFLDSGTTTTVWNRSADKAGPLTSEGARLAESAGAAVVASPVVVVCVTDYDAVHDILDPLDEVLEGRVVVNLTSGTSGQARRAGRWAAQRSAIYLDGAIMSDPGGIGGADTLVLYSGPQATFDQHAPTLRSLAGATTYLGDDHGLASLYDVALLGVMWGVLNGFLHGAALLGAAGIEATVFAALARPTIETVAGWVGGFAEQVDVGAYPADNATIDIHAGAMAHLVDEAEALGVDVELPRSVRLLAERAVADGHGGDSYAAMIEQFRKPAGDRS
jgi:3-hydroxyisobutyrate dehydrogenase-like beta-hydroxyacid dehydrogenase